MTLYQISVENRNYTSWSFRQVSNNEIVNIPTVEPFEDKLFHQDIFIVNKVDKLEIFHSFIRKKKEIPGVLVLSTKKTYGRNAKGKLLYKCIPNDTRLPSFLVPYEVKYIGFLKVEVNLFVTFTFQEWYKKHPIGTLGQIIGPISELETFCEYQMYCKEVNYSLKKMNHNVLPRVKNTPVIQEILAKFPQLENRTHTHRVFSIDPEGSLDFDDAFSVCENGKEIQLSIYIANVTIWLEYLNLWELLSEHRVSTVYLPDGKRPMLPPILSDHFCSLKEKEPRFAFVLDIIYCQENYKIVSTKITNAVICLEKNYVYEEPALFKNKDYLLLEKIVKKMSTQSQLKYMDSLNDSHDIVAYLMILMNHRCAEMLLEKKEGIFRSIVVKKPKDEDNVENVEKIQELPENVAKFIKMTNSYSGKYIDLSKETDLENISHSVLKIDAYIHITSPIRRLVDILNMIVVQEKYDILSLSQEARDFYKTWTEKIHTINIQMKQIRLLQNECRLLYFFTTNPDLLKVTHKGYTYHKQIKENETILTFQYTVYLPELNMMTWLLSEEELSEYSCHNFKLFVFHNEDKMKRKIRIQKE